MARYLLRIHGDDEYRAFVRSAATGTVVAPGGVGTEGPITDTSEAVIGYYPLGGRGFDRVEVRAIKDMQRG